MYNNFDVMRARIVNYSNTTIIRSARFLKTYNQ
jgi:hypothetical protein